MPMDDRSRESQPPRDTESDDAVYSRTSRPARNSSESSESGESAASHKPALADNYDALNLFRLAGDKGAVGQFQLMNKLLAMDQKRLSRAAETLEATNRAVIETVDGKVSEIVFLPEKWNIAESKVDVDFVDGKVVSVNGKKPGVIEAEVRKIVKENWTGPERLHPDLQLPNQNLRDKERQIHGDMLNGNLDALQKTIATDMDEARLALQRLGVRASIEGNDKYLLLRAGGQAIVFPSSGAPVGFHTDQFDNIDLQAARMTAQETKQAFKAMSKDYLRSAAFRYAAEHPKKN